MKHVLQFKGPVGRIDVDQNRSSLGGSELEHHPLGAVGGPYADTVAFLHAEMQQAARRQVNFIAQLAVGVAPALMAHNERVMVGIARRAAVEHLSNAATQQWSWDCPASIAS